MVVVAFYTGNDPIETFRLAYSNERWEKYQVDKSLSLNDMPKIEFPPNEKDLWDVKFNDNVSTVFTPKNRLYSNENSKVVKAGYDAMLMVAKEIASICSENNITPVFTVIPTKELVYKTKVINEINEPLPIYTKLVTQEQDYIDWLGGEVFQNTKLTLCRSSLKFYRRLL